MMNKLHLKLYQKESSTNSEVSKHNFKQVMILAKKCPIKSGAKGDSADYAGIFLCCNTYFYGS